MSLNISPTKKAATFYSGKMAEAVKVIVRCRPLNDREKSLNCKCIIGMVEESGQCSIYKPGQDINQPPKMFTFDGSYYVNSTTEQIYNDIAYPLVEGVVEGYNGTVFAYGQTGCGKSYSMQGVDQPKTQRGIIPRAFHHIFESISIAENTKYLVHASYLEIYNEEIRDLLSNNIKQKLELKEHPDRGVYVRELSMHPVSNVAECETVMASGWRNRSVGATLMNADSSRSHSIFTIYLEACDTGIDGGDHIRAGKLNLVDLAGSERQSKTGATGERLREATKINLSLSALGNVISALVDGKSKHIPYRDSKLTRLLQDSLGGNTKTLMVACLSPADNNYEETLSTLRYANRAKNIKNKPKINEDPKDALLREYQEEIKKLRGLLAGQLGPEGIKALLEGQSPIPQVKPPPAVAPVTDKSTVKDDLSEKMRVEFEHKLDDLRGKYEAEQMSKAKLQEDMNRLKSQYDEQLEHMNKMNGASSVTYQNQMLAGSSADTGFHESNEQSDAGSSQTSYNQQDGQVAKYIRTVDKNGVVTSDEVEEKQLHDEALKRLQMLQHNMVGGEKANDEAAKEKRRRRRKHVDEHRRQLALAANANDEAILLNVYDSIQDEIKARDKLISKKDRELEAAKMEVEDVSYEFERDRTEYLATIRKQEQEIAYLQEIINKIHPTVRRDCNYHNLDRIRSESKWNDDQQAWEVPEMKVMKAYLPPTGGGSNMSSRNLFNDVNSMNSQKLPQQTSTVEPYSQRSDSSEEDRYLHKLNRSSNEEFANNYFMPKRQVHHIISSLHSEQTPKGPSSFNGNNGIPNGESSSSKYSSSNSTSPLQMNSSKLNSDLGPRRPHRLDSLAPISNSTKSRRKKK